MDTSNKTRAVQPGDKYLIRFPEGMRDRIAEAAKENNRSTNAEIIARLDWSFPRYTGPQASGSIDYPSPEVLAEIERKAAEWGCSKTQALIRMTLEEIRSKD